MPEAMVFSAALLKVKVVYPDCAYRNKHLSLGKYVYKFTFPCVVISPTRFMYISQDTESPRDIGWKNESQQFQRLEKMELWYLLRSSF